MKNTMPVFLPPVVWGEITFWHSVIRVPFPRLQASTLTSCAVSTVCLRFVLYHCFHSLTLYVDRAKPLVVVYDPGHNQLSFIPAFLCFISVCPFVTLLKATIAENSHIIIKNRSFLTSLCVSICSLSLFPFTDIIIFLCLWTNPNHWL